MQNVYAQYVTHDKYGLRISVQFTQIYVVAQLRRPEIRWSKLALCTGDKTFHAGSSTVLTRIRERFRLAEKPHAYKWVQLEGAIPVWITSQILKECAQSFHYIILTLTQQSKSKVFETPKCCQRSTRKPHPSTRCIIGEDTPLIITRCLILVSFRMKTCLILNAFRLQKTVCFP